MRKYLYLFVSLVLFFGAIAAVVFFLAGNEIAVLSPEGQIASKQRELMLIALLLMLVVVIPVFVMAFWFAWRYREGNKKAAYTPEWDHDRRLEAIWWGVPVVIIGVLGGLIWTSSHDLDPFRPIAHTKKPLNVQVVALQWRWLFIYPELGIASVNYLHIPEDTPVNLKLTADAPMNSFWVPRLGGQVYAMAGMSTELHLIADAPGRYTGSSANLSGEGFAGMTFLTYATDERTFRQWVVDVERSPDRLDGGRYEELARPSKDDSMKFFRLEQTHLYEKIIAKYGGHSAPSRSGTHEGMTH